MNTSEKWALGIALLFGSLGAVAAAAAVSDPRLSKVTEPVVAAPAQPPADAVPIEAWVTPITVPSAVRLASAVPAEAVQPPPPPEAPVAEPPEACCDEEEACCDEEADSAEDCEDEEEAECEEAGADVGDLNIDIDFDFDQDFDFDWDVADCVEWAGDIGDAFTEAFTCFEPSVELGEDIVAPFEFDIDDSEPENVIVLRGRDDEEDSDDVVESSEVVVSDGTNRAVRRIQIPGDGKSVQVEVDGERVVVKNGDGTVLFDSAARGKDKSLAQERGGTWQFKLAPPARKSAKPEGKASATPKPKKKEKVDARVRLPRVLATPQTFTWQTAPPAGVFRAAPRAFALPGQIARVMAGCCGTSCRPSCCRCSENEPAARAPKAPQPPTPARRRARAQAPAHPEHEDHKADFH